ncbi:tubulin-like doman-containing protein [uncultured Variovorax sp.]|uniref:tubulin-like doman-containing protein n=1 Tax=uncultured Variovorax sp. TaxID=114708 RepID=UPI00263210DC|nr:tubulin-like doman-containing protein [uncultured Variovorax sp.]
MNNKAEANQENSHKDIHIVGIGRTGAVYVEALLRTGELEDMLAVPGNRFSGLLMDVNEDDMFVPNNYARSLVSRLATRGVSSEHVRYQSLLVDMPDAGSFAKGLESTRSAVQVATGKNLMEPLAKGVSLPKPGEHVPRAVSKALCALGLHSGAKPIDAALTSFAKHVAISGRPSTVLVVFGLAGGTGSGMASDVALALKAKLPANVKVVGVGQMSHSGDGEYHNNLSQTMAIESIEAASKDDSTANPFPGGFFVVLPEHSWQRLTAYTNSGEKDVRQRFRQMVTNRFVADSFVRWAAADNCGYMNRLLARDANKWILFDVAKLTHPGVQVLPGEPESRWDPVLQQWIEMTPQFSGISNDFRTDYAEVHLHTARRMNADTVDKEMKRVLASAYLGGKPEAISSFRNEFFDTLTSYVNIVLPGATKANLLAYKEARESLKKVDERLRAMEAA